MLDYYGGNLVTTTTTITLYILHGNFNNKYNYFSLFYWFASLISYASSQVKSVVFTSSTFIFVSSSLVWTFKSFGHAFPFLSFLQVLISNHSPDSSKLCPRSINQSFFLRQTRQGRCFWSISASIHHWIIYRTYSQVIMISIQRPLILLILLFWYRFCFEYYWNNLSLSTTSHMMSIILLSFCSSDADIFINLSWSSSDPTLIRMGRALTSTIPIIDPSLIQLLLHPLSLQIMLIIISVDDNWIH